MGSVVFEPQQMYRRGVLVVGTCFPVVRPENKYEDGRVCRPRHRGQAALIVAGGGAIGKSKEESTQIGAETKDVEIKCSILQSLFEDNFCRVSIFFPEVVAFLAAEWHIRNG